MFNANNDGISMLTALPTRTITQLLFSRVNFFFFAAVY